MAASASNSIKSGATLFLSEMPVGQRRVHEALVQTYSRDALPRYFEDFADFPKDIADPVSREALSDDEAIAALQRMRVNPFETGRFLVAGFISNTADALMSYDDESADEPPNRRESKLRLADATYSIGAVSDADTVPTAIWQDKNLSRAFARPGRSMRQVSIDQDLRASKGC